MHLNIDHNEMLNCDKVVIKDKELENDVIAFAETVNSSNDIIDKEKKREMVREMIEKKLKETRGENAKVVVFGDVSNIKNTSQILMLSQSDRVNNNDNDNKDFKIPLIPESMISLLQDKANSDFKSINEKYSSFKENYTNDGYHKQYDKYGQPSNQPIPKEFIPPNDLGYTPEAPFHKEPKFYHDKLETIREKLNFPSKEEEFPDILEVRSLPQEVPIEWTTLMIASLKFIENAKKSSLEIIKENPNDPNLLYKDGKFNFNLFPSGLYLTLRRFFIHLEDPETKIPVNWKTVYLVIFLMRQLPTVDCYNINPDLWSSAIGFDEYDIDNWIIKEDHMYRLKVISMITGDSLDLVIDFDTILRMKRSTCRLDATVTYSNFDKERDIKNYQQYLNEKKGGVGKPLSHKQKHEQKKSYTLGKGNFIERAFVFISFLNKEKKIQMEWFEIGLLDNIVKQVKMKRAEFRKKYTLSDIPYYDGPYCENCFNHHTSTLEYCKECYIVQYCNEKCKSEHKEKHIPICKRNIELRELGRI